MVKVRAIVPAPGVLSCFRGDAPVYLCGDLDCLCRRPEPDLPAKDDLVVYSRRIKVQPPGKRNSLAVYVNWRPRKKVPSHRGDTFGKFSFGALAGSGRGSGRSCAPRPSASKDDFDGGKPQGSRGIAGGRDHARKSLYFAAECSFGRVSRPGMHARMHAALIGDKGLDND